MTRAELIAYLEHKAHAFEGNNVHVDMSETLRAGIALIASQQAEIEYWYSRYMRQFKPSSPSSEPPRHAPDDT